MKKNIILNGLLIIILGFSLLMGSCGKRCKGAAKNNCACTMQYDPVCGCDGVTYGNACSAECSGVSDFTKGECK